MKYQKINILFLLILGIIFIGTNACTHNHDHEDHEGHDHSNHADHENDDDHDDHNDHDEEHAGLDDHGSQKIVILNEAQYINAEIDTGWFAMKNLSNVIHANGYTKLDPQDQAEVSMPLAGTVKSIKVIEGDYVKKGQQLGSIHSMDFNKIRLEKAKLKEEKALAEANQVYLQKEYNRQSALASESINAKKTLEKVSAELNMANAKISAVKEQIQLLEETIGSLGSGNSSFLPILSPISGYITHVDIKMGSMVPAGTPLFSVVDNSKMHVDLLVYEKDLNLVKIGQAVRFNLTNQSDTEIRGEIYNIGKSFASDTKSVAVHADIEKSDANLIPGMYLNALIEIGNETVQSLPEEAIVMAEGRHFIFLWEKENMESHDDHSHAHDEDHSHDDGHGHEQDDHHEKEITFARLEVKTGAKQLGFVKVTPLETIHDGDKIVTQGAYYLQSHLQKAEGGGGHHH